MSVIIDKKYIVPKIYKTFFPVFERFKTNEALNSLVYRLNLNHCKIRNKENMYINEYDNEIFVFILSEQ